VTRGILAGVVWVVAAVGAVGAVGMTACHKSRTPEEAFGRFSQAVAENDAGALFDALDKRSRWAWMTVQKSHREAYDIILSNYPEGRDREREQRRFERAAQLGSARELFIHEVGATALAKFPRPMPALVRINMEAGGESAFAVVASRLSLPFRKGPDGAWGYAGLADDAEERQRRALGDVELVRVNAADYERAAARNAR
jgi:hypothetical protein